MKYLYFPVQKVDFCDDNSFEEDARSSPWARGWNFTGDEALAREALEAIGGRILTFEAAGGEKYLSLEAGTAKIDRIGVDECPDMEILIFRLTKLPMMNVYENKADYLVLMRMPGFADETDAYTWGFRSDPLPL